MHKTHYKLIVIIIGILLYSIANTIATAMSLKLEKKADFGTLKLGEKIPLIKSEICIQNKLFDTREYTIVIKSAQASPDQFYLKNKKNGNTIAYTIKWFDPKNNNNNQETGVKSGATYSAVRRCFGQLHSYLEITIPTLSSSTPSLSQLPTAGTYEDTLMITVSPPA